MILVKKFRSRTIALMAVFALVIAPFATSPAAADSSSGTFLSGTHSGRNYKVYIPQSYVDGTPVPLMVMLHGGTQDPSDFAAGTQMNSLADLENFIVLYPEQTYSANYLKCWNWFLPAHQFRGSGEPAIIAGMVDLVKSQYSIDSSKVFAAGFSAGGGMAVVLGATYPDVFSGIGSASGLEYKAASTTNGAYSAMDAGGPNPDIQGELAYSTMGNYARTVPVIAFQGSADTTIYPINGDQVLSQWAKTNDLADDGSANGSIDDIADITSTGTANAGSGKDYTRYCYHDASGDVIMEKYIVEDLGHDWSGGSLSGSYTDPTGPDCSEIMYHFFMSVTNSILPVDKATLQTAVTAAEAIDLSEYTQESAEAVISALSAANAVLADEDATQDQVTAAAANLSESVAALVPLTPCEGSFISGSYGFKSYQLYIPGCYEKGASLPLMVMLHGSSQDSETFASETRMNEQADALGFFVLYPEQTYSANYLKCWNWFLPAHQSRGSGEPAVIAGMTTKVMNDYSIDENRIYVSGLGGGGAMTVVMGTAYPDLYSGIGVAAGLEYKAASSLSGAYSAMYSGGPDPDTQGQLAYNAMGSRARTIPVMVFQGSSDTTINPVNGHQVLSQWAKTNDLADDGSANGSIDDTADEIYSGTASGENGKDYTRYVYHDAGGNIIMEKYIISGMDFGWSGGSSDGLNTDPAGPDMSEILCEFFLNQ